jgi:hypothetical protein
MARRGEPKYSSAADELWRRTGADWTVEVHHVLTEPVCPNVRIYSDDATLPRGDYIGTSYDVNASIAEACKRIIDQLPPDRNDVEA